MLSRQAYPTTGQGMDGGVVKEVVRSQQDEPKPAEAVCRFGLLGLRVLNGLLEERRPGRVAGRDQGRVAIEEEVHRARRGLWKLRDGLGLAGDLAQDWAGRCRL